MNNGALDYYRAGHGTLKRMRKGSLCINAVSSGTISVNSTYVPQSYNMFTGQVIQGKYYPPKSDGYRVATSISQGQMYDYSPWCTVKTDFYKYIKIVAYEHEDNRYNAGCKYIPYTAEALQRIRDTFERQVTLTYKAGCKVITTLYRQPRKS